MSQMADLHRELAKAGSLPQPEPTRAEMVAEELRAFPRWQYQAIRATYPGVCHVCLGEIQPGQAIYRTRSGQRRQWHTGCHPRPVVAHSTGTLLDSECGLPACSAILAPSLPDMPPACAEARHSHSRTGAYRSENRPPAGDGVAVPPLEDRDSAFQPGVFVFYPLPVQVGAPGRQWTAATVEACRHVQS